MEFWIKTDRKTALRILRIVDEILRDPFTGIGKPEPLKDFGSDAWSRRITQEHRLVYLVGDDRIDFLQARHHY
jgi:toxin YoeB